MNNWIGLIPAAGRGIRPGLPYPKERYPVIRDNRCKPVTQYVLENLATARVRQIIFMIQDRAPQIAPCLC